MTDMVEQVALEFCRAGESVELGGAPVCDKACDSCRSHANAAIRIMYEHLREPSEAVVQKGVDEAESERNIAEIYIAMIDQAMKEAG